MAAERLKIRVVSPREVVYEGEGIALVAPAWDGKVGILPGHAAYTTLLGAGRLDIDLPGGGSERFYVDRGVLRVESDEVTVLTEYAGREKLPGMSGSSWLEPAELSGDVASEAADAS
ncbi:MAG: hypothetical protein WD960_10890 [Gemmatimonadota bacterium]